MSPAFRSERRTLGCHICQGRRTCMKDKRRGKRKAKHRLLSRHSHRKFRLSTSNSSKKFSILKGGRCESYKPRCSTRFWGTSLKNLLGMLFCMAPKYKRDVAWVKNNFSIALVTAT